MSITC